MAPCCTSILPRRPLIALMAGLLAALLVLGGPAASAGEQPSDLGNGAEGLLLTLQQVTPHLFQPGIPKKLQSGRERAGLPAVKSVAGAGELGRVIVRLRPAAESETVLRSLRRAEVEPEIRLLKTIRPVAARQGTAGTLLVLTSETLDSGELLALLRQLPQVEHVERDALVTLLGTSPNDPRFAEQWGLHNSGQTGGVADADIDAPEAWDRVRGGSGIVVGIVDTGLDVNHPDLQANVWSNTAELNGLPGVDDDNNGHADDIHGWNAIGGNGDIRDDHGHGSSCAGIVGAAGNNGTGMSGVNWQVGLAGCKMLNADGGGYVSDAVECLNYFSTLKQQGVNLVAVSTAWGGDDSSQTLKDAVATAGALGILCVAAAGNDGRNIDGIPRYPASLDAAAIISVAASDALDQVAEFSNYGPLSVDLFAPGVDVLSTVPATPDCANNDTELLLHDGFEAGLGWQLTAWVNTVADTGANFALTAEDSQEGGYAVTESPAGNYRNSTVAVMTRPLNLASASTRTLCGSFQLTGSAEAGWDFLHVSISGDGGESWSQVRSLTGEFSEWSRVSFGIPQEYATGDFQLSLSFASDSSIVQDGYFIDDVRLGPGTMTYAARYDVTSGTSLAAAHVAGAAALAAAAFPADDVAQRKQRILAAVDVKAAFGGKCLSGGRLNIGTMLATAPKTGNLQDFNGDGHPDLVWRNMATGANHVWYLNGVQYAGGGPLGSQADPDWHIVGVADVNGDGHPDLVWRNTATGANHAWFLRDLDYVGDAAIAGGTNLSWQLVAVADINRDGHADFLWRHAVSGANAVWYMNNAVLAGTAALPTAANQSWILEAAADMDQNLSPDLIWFNEATGEVALWYLDGVRVLDYASVATINDRQWKIVAVQDMNGDGHPDFVWRHRSTGAAYVWYMQGAVRIGGEALPLQPDLAWNIVNAGN